MLSAVWSMEYAVKRPTMRICESLVCDRLIIACFVRPNYHYVIYCVTGAFG